MTMSSGTSIRPSVNCPLADISKQEIQIYKKAFILNVQIWPDWADRLYRAC